MLFFYFRGLNQRTWSFLHHSRERKKCGPMYHAFLVCSVLFSLGERIRVRKYWFKHLWLKTWYFVFYSKSNSNIVYIYTRTRRKNWALALWHWVVASLWTVMLRSISSSRVTILTVSASNESDNSEWTHNRRAQQMSCVVQSVGSSIFCIRFPKLHCKQSAGHSCTGDWNFLETCAATKS